MRSALAAALILIAAPVAAQMAMPKEAPGKADPARVTAGTYQIEAGHTQVRFGVDHLGFNPYYGVFSDAKGSLTIDPAKPGAAALSVEVPVASVQTTSTRLTEELKGKDWLDAAAFPTMSFKSSGVRVSGTTAAVAGQLTLHGVTRPVTLQAKFTGAGPGMMGGKPTLGFTATGSIKRSDFGVTRAVPLIGDEVSIDITAAFEAPAAAK